MNGFCSCLPGMSIYYRRHLHGNSRGSRNGQTWSMARLRICPQTTFPKLGRFRQQARDYFLTMETRDMAIKKLQGTTQKGDIEEYLTEFKGWANLTGFDDVA
jgi:hypothetical protein